MSKQDLNDLINRFAEDRESYEDGIKILEILRVCRDNAVSLTIIKTKVSPMGITH